MGLWQVLQYVSTSRLPSPGASAGRYVRNGPTSYEASVEPVCGSGRAIFPEAAGSYWPALCCASTAEPARIPNIRINNVSEIRVFIIASESSRASRDDFL